METGAQHRCLMHGLAAAAACAWGMGSVAAPAAAPLTPQSVRQQVTARGARKTVDGLDEVGQYDRVLEAIGAGATAWVSLAPILVAGTDASNTMGLRVAMATALPVNPAAVLRSAQAEGTGNEISVSLVCEIPFIEPTPAFVADYRRRAVAAVGAVHDPALADRRSACLKSLNSP